MSVFDSSFYRHWREIRFNFIVKTLGSEFFKNKTILELGAAEGDLGHMFYSKFGCSVVCLEGRLENIEKGKKKFPHLTFVQFDADQDMDKWDSLLPAKRFDIILHLGLLYHTLNVIPQLMECLRRTNACFVLETEVLDYDKPSLLFQYEGVSQSCKASSLETGPCKNHLTRASVSWIENVFSDYNKEIKHLHAIECCKMDKCDEKETETNVEPSTGVITFAPQDHNKLDVDVVLDAMTTLSVSGTTNEINSVQKEEKETDKEQHPLPRLIHSMKRHQDGSMNCSPFIYDWTATGSSLRGGLRSLWIVTME